MIVMVLSGEIVVVFNATAARRRRRRSTRRARRLHPALAERESRYADGAFTVPARTVAVFLP